MSVSTPVKLGIGALALIGVFLLGYAPASLNAHAARSAQERLTHKLAVATLQVQLGMMSNEVNRDNYGLAAQMATPFFDGVSPVIAATDPADQEVSMALQAVLARRDEITSDLAQANPQVKTKLADLCADLYRLTQAP
jgi:hypothetical protein